jgi:hypothetical protein
VIYQQQPRLVVGKGGGMTARHKVICPVCGESVALDSFMEIGGTLTCFGCDTLFRIVEIDPPEVEVDSDGDLGGIEDEAEDNEELYG